MRLFVAFELPEALRRQVGHLVDSVRGSLPGARWVWPENLHLTLVFLGEVEGDGLAALRPEAARVFAGWAAGRLRLAGGGTFPPRRPARVVWIGLEPAPGLLELQTQLAAALLSALGRRPESRPFHPHLTLARCRRPWPRRAVERWEAAVPARLGEPFPVEQGSLIESRLERSGARYETLETFPLAGERCLA